MVSIVRSTGKDVDNFSYEEIDDAVTITVPTFQLMIVIDILEIRGTLILEGSIAIGTL